MCVPYEGDIPPSPNSSAAFACPYYYHVCAASNKTTLTTTTTNATLLIGQLYQAYPNLTVGNATIVVMSFLGDYSTVIGEDGSDTAIAFTKALLKSIELQAQIDLPHDVPVYFLSGGSYIVAFLLMPNTVDADDTNTAVAVGRILFLYNSHLFKALPGCWYDVPKLISTTAIALTVSLALLAVFILTVLGVFMHKRRRQHPLPRYLELENALPSDGSEKASSSSGTNVCVSM